MKSVFLAILLLTGYTGFATLSVSIEATNVSCFGHATGAAAAVVYGDTTSYYLWSTGATTASINGLTSNMYSVTVTSSSGVSASASALVAQPSTAVGVSLTVSAAGCSNTGSVVATAANGTPSYTYVWSNAFVGASNQYLPAGNYTVTVADAAGCTVAATGTVTQQSITLGVSLAVTPTGCINTGGVTATASNGIGAYTYVWSNGFHGNANQNLGAGNYTVTVTDAQGCTVAATGSIVQQPNTLGVSLAVTPTGCINTGGVTAMASNGIGAYTYVWSNGFHGNANQNLGAGNYTVTVTDAQGCTVAATGTIIQPPSTLAVILTITNTVCNTATGSATANATGGTSGYTYHWSNNVTTPLNQNLSAGNYSVTITDAQSCSVTGAGNVTSPPSPTVSLIVHNPACHNDSTGSVLSVVTGGTRSYNYAWSNGTTGQSLSRLRGPDTITLIVIDANNCTASAGASLTNPPLLSIGNIAISPVTNSAINDGSVTISPTGGTAPYTIRWSNGQRDTFSATNLGVGQYSVVLSDFNGCAVSNNFNVPLATALNPLSCALDFFNVFPNPANNSLKTQVQLSAPGLMQIKITDVQGKALYQNIASTDYWNSEINTTKWPAGLYEVVVQVNNELLKKQVVIMHR